MTDTKLIKVGCEVHGLAEIEMRLRAVGPYFARKVMRSALRKVGKFWIEDMKGRVPVDTGDLRDSIAGRVRTHRPHAGKGGVGEVIVGPRYDRNNANRPGDTSQQPGVYGQFVEFGTAKMAAEPFMRPCFDATTDKVINLFADEMRAGLDGINELTDHSGSMSDAMDEMEEDIDEGSSSGGILEKAPDAIRGASKSLRRALRKLLG